MRYKGCQVFGRGFLTRCGRGGEDLCFYDDDEFEFEFEFDCSDDNGPDTIRTPGAPSL
jgi:hypothetical protein